jgi:hypothetical protein
MIVSRHKRLAAVAFVALVVFGAAFAEAAFVHTDDGCTLEIHCLACRWTVGTTAVVAPVFVFVATVGATAPLPVETPTLVPATDDQAPTSRGPPAA